MSTGWGIIRSMLALQNGPIWSWPVSRNGNVWAERSIVFLARLFSAFWMGFRGCWRSFWGKFDQRKEIVCQSPT